MFLLLVLIFVLFAYLHLVGLPAYFTDGFLDRMSRQGYFLQIERLTMEIDRGLVARNVRLFMEADAPKPFMEAAELTVALHPVPLFRRRQIVPILSIVDGSLRADLGRNQFGARQGSQEIAVDQIQLRFTATEREVILREFSADLLGIHFRGRGTVYPATKTRTRIDNPLTAAVQAIEDAPAWILRLVEQANQISFNEPPSADFTFSIRPGQPQTDSVAFQLSNLSGGEVRGVPFDRFDLDVALKDQQIQLPNLQIQKGNNVLGLSGWYDLTNQMVSVHLLNTLPPDTFIDLLPDPVQVAVATVVTNCHFPLRLELQAGPAPVSSLAQQFSGNLSLSQAILREVPIEKLDVAFRRAGNEIRVEQAAVQLDAGPDASRLKIRDGFYLLDRKQFEARAKGTFNPHVLKPLMTPNFRAIVEWFGIQEPLRGSVVVGGVVGNPAIYCFGPVQATHFTINGAAVQSAQGQLDITNEVMHLTGATLVRPEGIARGDVHMAFSNQTLRLERVDSTIDPRAAAQMIGPVAAKFMEPFLINGPVHVQVDGLLDYCNFSLNHLKAHVEAQRFGYYRWEADAAEFDLSVRGLRLLFTNAVGTAYGGQFAGTACLYPVGRDSNWRYEVNLAANNASLSNLLSASTGKPAGELRGTLDGTARVGGYIGEGNGPSVTGAGHVDVRGGLLLQTKLFSGLAAILSKIIPDFTLFAQTDASGNFTIRNSRIISRDVQLKGTLFGVKASGDYAFDTALDFRVEVQLLRSGPVAALVRLATLPVTRLLEFHLTGTFEEPRWRSVNLNLADLFPSEEKVKDKSQVPKP